MRLAARTDANHADIAGALEQVGCSVQSLAAVGKGVPDLLVGVAGTNLLFEIKNGPHAVLTGPQRTWHGGWHGKVHTVDSVSAALDLVAYYRGRLRRP